MSVRQPHTPNVVLNRTYEGLKFLIPLTIFCFTRSFESNLWGIEMCWSDRDANWNWEFWIKPMRDWNSPVKLSISVSASSFESNLWGIEIMQSQRSSSSRLLVLNRTYEGLKYFTDDGSGNHYYSFESNLWGIEMRVRKCYRTCYAGFWIEPMRDWNTHNGKNCLYYKMVLNRTYEGLKFEIDLKGSINILVLNRTYEGLKYLLVTT